MQRSDIAVLLVSTGTPADPSAGSVRRYLKEFLSDTRIVEMPRLLWLPILYGIVLAVRPAKSAERYRKIWTPEGSPLAVNGEALCRGIGAKLAEKGLPAKVFSAMRYGSPSVSEKLDEIAALGIERVLVLPLFPQYCPQTVGASVDAVAKYCLQSRNPPALRTVKRFYDRAGWAEAVAARVRESWKEKGALPAAGAKLLFSFHGVPEACVTEKGDRYRAECEESAELIAASLSLPREAWEVTFQSRFGPAEWLRPYTSVRVGELAREGVSRVDVVCPSFTCDCLETREEIEIDAKEAFLAADPKGAFNYIPCINASEEALSFYASLVEQELQGWL